MTNQNSIIHFYNSKQLRLTLKNRVYNYLIINPNSTAKDISEKLKIRINVVTPRLNELVYDDELVSFNVVDNINHYHKKKLGEKTPKREMLVGKILRKFINKVDSLDATTKFNKAMVFKLLKECGYDSI